MRHRIRLWKPTQCVKMKLAIWVYATDRRRALGREDANKLATHKLFDGSLICFGLITLHGTAIRTCDHHSHNLE